VFNDTLLGGGVAARIKERLIKDFKRMGA